MDTIITWVESLGLSGFMIIFTVLVGAPFLFGWWLLREPPTKPRVRPVSTVPDGLVDGSAGPGLRGIVALERYGKNLAAKTEAAPRKPDPENRIARESAKRQLGKKTPDSKK